jgi:exosome complex RNA-binding protein Rrp4
MQVLVEELAELISRSNKSEPNLVKMELGLQIVVADRGFVYIGKTRIDGEFVTITEARNIRVWGTTQGLGELVNGPTGSTKLDNVGEILLPLRAVIHFIKCTRDW